MHVITKRQAIMSGQERWLKEYARHMDHIKADWCDRTYGDIRAAVSALETDKCSEQELDQATGIAGWAARKCDECGEKKEALVHFGEVEDYEARWQRLCIDCLRKGIEIIRNSTL